MYEATLAPQQAAGKLSCPPELGNNHRGLEMTEAMTAVLEELLDEETLIAFEDAWPKDPEIARAEAANIAAILANANGEEHAQFLVDLVHALIQTFPCPLAWILALSAEGAIELRRARKHAKDAPSPSRAIANCLRAIDTKQRRLKPGESSASLGRDHVRLRMLIAATLLMKLRQLVGPVAAIGPGWTLMCALGETKDKTLQRKLHEHGANREFRRSLYDAVGKATDQWIARNEADASESLSRAALWKNTVPVGIDVMAFFGDRSLKKYRSELFNELGFKEGLPRASLRLAEEDAAIIRDKMPRGVPEPPYSYLSDERKSVPSICYLPEDHDRLRRMMSALTKRNNREDLQMLAARSLARKRERDDRHPAFQTQRDQLENEIESWVMKGAAPPAYMRFEDSHLFEEDACRAFLSGETWPGLTEWRRFKFFPENPEKAMPIKDLLSQLEEIPDPQALY